MKFYERGSRPLEIVTTRQWYIRNGGRDAHVARRADRAGTAAALVPVLHAPALRIVDRRAQRRLVGVAAAIISAFHFRSGTRLDAARQPRLRFTADHPTEDILPIDPESDTPPGYTEDQRDQPGGFTADPDVMDTWATSSFTPQIACGWEDDPDLFARTFPWTCVRRRTTSSARGCSRRLCVASRARRAAVVERGDLRLGARSGSQEDVEVEGQRRHADGVAREVRRRRRALLGRVGRAREPTRRSTRTSSRSGAGSRPRSSTCRSSCSRRAVPHPTTTATLDDPAHLSETLDRSMLAALDALVDEATVAFDDYDYARALERTERFFWVFCDNYVELVKGRAYGAVGEAGGQSAAYALRRALSTLLRLLRAVPAVRDRRGVVVVARRFDPRRVVARARRRGRPASRGAKRSSTRSRPSVLSEVRKVKSSEQAVARDTGGPRGRVADTQERFDALEAARADVCEAGKIRELLTKALPEGARVASRSSWPSPTRRDGSDSTVETPTTRSGSTAHVNLEAGIGTAGRRYGGRRRRRWIGSAALLELLGSPEHEFPVVHLTGTNGKTSTSRMISALLESLGLSVGRYTSPNLETRQRTVRVERRAHLRRRPRRSAARDRDGRTVARRTAELLRDPHCGGVPLVRRPCGRCRRRRGRARRHVGRDQRRRRPRSR